MSKAALLLVTSWLLAPALWGQDTMMARLRSRSDSLLHAWREAQTLAGLADSLERERAAAGRDTVAVGGLRIIANPSALPLREAAVRAWPAFDSLYGTAAADFTQNPFIVRAVDPDPAVRRQVLHIGVELPWDLDVTALTRVLLTSMPAPALDPLLADWLGGPLRPAIRSRDEKEEVFLQLVTAPSEAVRGCFLGELARCKAVLQLGDTAGLLEQWYATPREREALVTGSFAGYFEGGATAPGLRSCRAHDDAACTSLLRSLSRGTLPKPLAHAARMVLVREALRAGGREAYRRLTSDPAASMGDRLVRASGLELDTLLARWRASVLAERPAPLTLPWWAVVAAVGWTAFFGGCALRSSRWRV